MSIPLQEKIQFLLLDSQTLGSPTFGFQMSVAKGCVTSQEDASEFPLEGSTPSCPLRDGLDLSSTRPQPGGGEPLSSSHLHHCPLDPAEVDPPKAAHLRTFAPCTLHKLADRQGHLFGVVSQFLISWDTSRVQTRPW